MRVFIWLCLDNLDPNLQQLNPDFIPNMSSSSSLLIGFFGAKVSLSGYELGRVLYSRYICVISGHGHSV